MAIKEKIKALAQQYGFDHCGVAQAVALDEDARRLEAWLAQGMHGGMAYMANHFDLRIDPRKLVPGAQSVITFLKNYYPEQIQATDVPQVSKYAYGHDYHDIIRQQLNQLLAELRSTVGAIEGRGFVDSAPVLERTWAVRSGLGWVGKNGNLIHKQAGSFFFIATLITDLALPPDDPFARDYCGSCTRCIDACPTAAILPNKVVDGSRCISYFTIELKEAMIPGEMADKFDNRLFGCDICQDVCPWNRFAQPHAEPALSPIPEVLAYTRRDWEQLSEAAFRQVFKKSPLRRTGWKGIQRNLSVLGG